MARSSLRTWILRVAVAASTCLLASCYVVRQSIHHNNLFNSREPVEQVIRDPTTATTTREKLQLTQTIIDYAASQGLHTEGAYRYYIENEGDVVSFLVYAAEPLKLAVKKHWFPIVGSVPYLGFFEKSERDVKAKELAQEGFDVYQAEAGAFSSLGWFEDPIFSSMLNRDIAALAHLFFHELTHRTVWISGSTTFNEHLAEWVATEMTPDFLQRSGRGDLIPAYRTKRRDRALFKSWLKELREALTSVYARNISNAEKRTLKQTTFHHFTSGSKKPKFEAYDYVGKREWNNARLLAASLYSPEIERFQRAYRCLKPRSIKRFLTKLDQIADDFDEPFAAVDALCASE